MITASLVKELRAKTNAGMMDCKRALQETDGDMDAAIKLLREKGIAKAAKKADRAANEGIIAARIDPAGKSGILLEVNCETDFVSKNDNFKGLVNDLADTLAGGSATNIDEALVAKFADGTVDDVVKAKVIEIGENLQFRRFIRLAVEGEGVVGSYIHMGGKVGVLLEVGCEKAATVESDTFKTMVRDITLHIAAANPQGISRDDISTDIVDAEKDIFRAQMAESGKPPDPTPPSRSSSTPSARISATPSPSAASPATPWASEPEHRLFPKRPPPFGGGRFFLETTELFESFTCRFVGSGQVG